MWVELRPIDLFNLVTELLHLLGHHLEAFGIWGGVLRQLVHQFAGRFRVAHLSSLIIPATARVEISLVGFFRRGEPRRPHQRNGKKQENNQSSSFHAHNF